ncbi:MAG: polysaccharide biosynthesis/export family protein [Paludisphaera borealis]|uniref:polysaccharide biosynthesis/export family protein n=1 Tax=Paludisphaera borealis TaxID=1387353 RepID=UPI00283D26BF|nr:polysaccharide biosynthesis/export family protein [Paludisphaera borealis]MDR3618429.1 polysaccharide biosynthesis/export family protein [Paludisphaera borealis]
MSRSVKFATACVVGGFLALGAFGAAAQEAKSEEKIEASAPSAQLSKEDALTAEIDKRFDAFDLSPQPLPEIPDNPPPHEGAMIDMPEYRIEPPDLVLIEVLEALPGRPISGERLVRPDGMITLGFYGEINVRGLTIAQAKVKIIKHLRLYLTDEILGLHEAVAVSKPPKPDQKLLPPAPAEVEKLLEKLKQELERSEGLRKELEKPEQKPKGISIPEATAPSRVRVRSISNKKQVRPTDRWRPRNSAGLYFARGLERPKPDETDAEEPGKDDEPKSVEEPAKVIEIPLQDDAEISIRINVKKGSQSPGPAPFEMEANAGSAEDGFDYENHALPPHTSDRVFVDVSAYNSKNYFVLGDVGAAGKIPITGNETVLDALQYGGGLLPTAEPKDIRLVRPGRNGKPGKVYKVDLEAIQDRGETATNYQIFPGDRLIIGRNEVVKKTIQMDRLSTAIQDVINSVQQEAQMVRSVKLAVPDQPDVMIKNLVEFWIKELNRPEGATFNEETLREILLRSLPVKPDAPKANK